MGLGSSPSGGVATVAQSEEQSVCNGPVSGSIPFRGSALLCLLLLGCAPARYVRAGDVWGGTGECQCEQRTGHVLCLAECSREECLACVPARRDDRGQT